MKIIILITLILFITLSGFASNEERQSALCQVRGSTDHFYYTATNPDPSTAVRLAEKDCKAAGNYSCYYAGCF